MSARAVVWEHEGPEGITVVQLDVILQLWVGRWMIESCAGYGGSHSDALKRAFEAFAASALPPILVAFFHTDDEVARDARVIGDVTRAVTIGPVVERGETPKGGVEDGWYRRFEELLDESPLPEGAHWIRVYYAQHDGETMAKEVLLDNEPWDWMADALQGVTWPMGPGFWSARVFLVVQGGVDVSRAVATMVEMPGQPDAEISVALAKDGADPREVQELLAYVPLAFGRVALHAMPIQFSDTALVQASEDEDPAEIRLADDPVFAQAFHQARSALDRGTLTQDQFLVVAARSAEVHAVNQALEQGAEAKDLSVSAPKIRLF